MRNSDLPKYLLKMPITMFNLMRGKYYLDYDMMKCSCESMPWVKRWNVIASGLNMVIKKTSVINMPVYAFFELTSYCNLKCPLCPTGTKMLKRKAMNMDVELYIKVMNELSPYLLTACLWGWGEPLLHPQIGEILKASYNRGVNIIVSTNGQNLNDEKVIDAILRYPPTYLIVALDGITDETNSVYRKGAKLQPALEGVNKIYHRRKGEYPILNMRHIVMKQNEHESSELVEFAKRNYFDILTIRTLCDLLAGSASSLLPEASKYRNLTNKKYDYVCDMALNTPMICSDGTLDVCCQDYQEPLMQYGDLKVSSFRELWHSTKAAELRHQIFKNPEKMNCKDCSKRVKLIEAETVERYDLR
jgi:MoaA/NifB/PqqE/SkfB family radical SAM enzyme